MAYDAVAHAKKAAKQAVVVRRMKPEEVRVELWLSCFRAFFPDERGHSSKEREHHGLKRFRAEYGERKMDSITALECQAWALSCPAYELTYLLGAWDKATLMQIVPLNVWKFVVAPRRPKQPVQPPSLEKITEVLGYAIRRARESGEFRECVSAAPWLTFHDAVEVCMHTGLRQHELLSIKRRDVDMTARRVTVLGKRNKVRTVALVGRSWLAMSSTINRQNKIHPRQGAAPGPLFPLSKGKLQDLWQEARGGFVFGFHSLRHYAATWMEAEGVDPLDIAQQLGHTDAAGRPTIEMLRKVYAHPNAEAALDRIAERLR